MKDHEGIHLLGKLYTASHFGRIHDFRCARTPHTIITQRYYRNYSFVLHTLPIPRNESALKVWVQVFRNLPYYAIFIHPLLSFHLILIRWKIPFPFTLFHSIQFMLLSCWFISFQFIWFHIPSWLYLFIWIIIAMRFKIKTVSFDSVGLRVVCRRTIWLHFSGTLPGATAFSCYPW